MIGRALTKDEEVNHKDRDRRNFWFENLYILGSKDHGWVSAKQSHYMRHQEARDRAEWEAFMAAEEARQAKEIARAKNEGKPWVSPTDGSLQEAWDQRHEA